MASCEETHNNGSTDGEDLPAVGVGAHDCDCDCEAPGEERLKLACSKLAGALTVSLTVPSCCPVRDKLAAFRNCWML